MAKKNFFSVATWTLCAGISLCGCMRMESQEAAAMAPETVVMDKNVEFTTDVVDELGSSVVNVDIELSTIAAGESGYYTFKPSMGLEYVLQDESIEVPSLDAFDFSKFTTEVVKNETIDESSRGGANVVVAVYYDNTQVGTLTYGWSFEKKIIEEVGQVYPAPHLEVSRYAVMEQVIVSEASNGYVVEAPVNVTIQKVGANSSAETTVTLRPRYNLVIAAPEPEPEYTFEVVWGEWHDGDVAADGHKGHYQPVEIYVNKYVNGELQRRDRSYVELHAAGPANSVFQTMVGTEGAMLQLVEIDLPPVEPFVRNEYFTFNVKDRRVEVQLEGIAVDFTEYSSCTVTYTDGEFSKDITFEMAYEYAFSKVDRKAEALASDPAWSYFTYLNSEVCEITTTKVVNTDGVESKGDLEPMMRTVTVDKFK